MSERDHISELFQRNQHKLDERPPSDLWGKLENRLDKRKKPSFGYVKYFAAASVFLALSCSLVIFYQLNKNELIPTQAEPIAQTILVPEVKDELHLPPPPVLKEDLKEVKRTETQASGGSAAPVDAVANVTAPLATVEFKPFEGFAEELSSKPEAGNVAIADNLKFENKVEKEVANEKIALSDDVAQYEYPSMTNAQAPGRAESAPASPEAASKDNNRKNDRYGDVAMEDDEVASAKPKSKDAASKKERYKSAEGKKRNIEQQDINPNIQRFMWLAGTWRDGNFEGESYETWELKDGNTLEGRGYLVVDGDTLLTERLTLQQEGESFYYVAAVDNFNRRVKFKLVSINGDRSTFEQYSEGFPSQIVLERKPDGGYSFEMESQNGGYTNDQTTYLSKRNFVAKEKTVRRMSKKK